MTLLFLLVKEYLVGTSLVLKCTFSKFALVIIIFFYTYSVLLLCYSEQRCPVFQRYWRWL